MLPLLIRATIQPFVAKKKAVGAAVGVLTPDGEQVFAAGKIAYDAATEPDGNTLFEIGSIGKVFTALLLAEMAERGLVHLDDSVRKHLPGSVRLPARGDREMTLLHLATHTSGLPGEPANLKPRDRANPYADYQIEQLYQSLAVFRLGREPGSRYEYSNVGMGLLGHVLSLRAGLPYEELVVKTICDPLGMMDTRINLSEGQRGRLARGHTARGQPTANWDVPALAGAGALRSTANDLLRFLAAQLGQAPTPLRPAIERSQEVRHQEDMALGMSRRPREGKATIRVALGWHLGPLLDTEQEVVWHNGATGGYQSFLGFVKQSGTGVVVLTNSGLPSSALDFATGNPMVADAVGLEALQLLNGA
jgi:CubicO group peptidase (beta-lactamase class C family)